jgi:hypothetical protein
MPKFSVRHRLTPQNNALSTLSDDIAARDDGNEEVAFVIKWGESPSS